MVECGVMNVRLTLFVALAAVALVPLGILWWVSRPLVEDLRRIRVKEASELIGPALGMFDETAQRVEAGVEMFQRTVGEQNLDPSRLAREDWWWGKSRDVRRLRAALDRQAERTGLDELSIRMGTRAVYTWPRTGDDAPADEPAPPATAPAAEVAAPGWRWDPATDEVTFVHALPLGGAVSTATMIVTGRTTWPRDFLEDRLRQRVAGLDGIVVELRGRLPGEPPLEEAPGVLTRTLVSPTYAATVAAVIDPRSLRAPAAEALEDAIKLVALLGAVAAAVLALALGQFLSGPLRRLTRAVNEVAEEGAPQAPMPPGPGEIGRLAHSIDTMLARLLHERTERRRAERTAAWQEVARRVAHEIRNPLTPIRLAVDNMARASRRSPQALAACLDDESAAIRDEVARLERLVREFSDFARLPRPQPSPTDLTALSRRAVQGQLPDTPGLVTLEVRASDDPVIADVDADLLALAVANLASNAVRVLGEDGGTLTLEITGTEEGAAGTPTVCLSLTDDGPGFPPDLLESIFEPYVSGRTGENVGLGLATVRQIVQEHRGRVAAENLPGGGARVSLWLPRHAERTR